METGEAGGEATSEDTTTPTILLDTDEVRGEEAECHRDDDASDADRFHARTLARWHGSVKLLLSEPVLYFNSRA